MVHVGCRRMEAYVPLAEYVLGPNNTEAVAFYTGTGDAGILSDVCGLLVSWTFFYVGTVSFYHIFAPLAAWYARVFHPDRQTNKVRARSSTQDTFFLFPFPLSPFSLFFFSPLLFLSPFFWLPVSPYVSDRQCMVITMVAHRFVRHARRCAFYLRT